MDYPVKPEINEKNQIKTVPARTKRHRGFLCPEYPSEKI
jgi:hypothetical protein